MEEKRKNILIGILIGIIVILIGVFCYLGFIKKSSNIKSTNDNNQQVNTNNSMSDNEKENDKNNENKSENNLNRDNGNNIEVIGLTVNNQEIKFNNQIIEIKIDENNIYLNNKMVGKNYGYDNINAIIDQKFIILFWPGAQAGNLILGYINEDLEYVDSDKWLDNSINAINNLHYYNYKLYGEMSVRSKYNNERNEYDYDFKNIEFVYENKKLKINKSMIIYELEAMKEENEYELKSQSFMFNGNIVHMKLNTIDEYHSDLYINDKKVATYDYDHVVIYVMDKYMIISWPGTTCGELVLGYINENLDHSDLDIDIFNTDYGTGIYQENGKIVADKTINDVELCGSRKKIEFVYLNRKLITKDVK